MKNEDIHLWDVRRVLFGEAPAEFLEEVFIRTAIIYLILMVAMRLMGKEWHPRLVGMRWFLRYLWPQRSEFRSSHQTRGSLPSFIIATIVVVTQQTISKKASKDEKFETLTQDNIGTLLKDSRLDLAVMKKTRLTKERIFGQLRNQEIHHLGEVRRMYLEANGTFTVIEDKNPPPGLVILPDWGIEFIKKVCEVSEEVVCSNCGNRKIGNQSNSEKCENCGIEKWINAME